MRQGTNNGRRPRGRTNRKQHGGGGGGGGGGGQPGTRTFDSNGPDGRVRGNARQVYEKYLSLARDATSAGDRVAAEAYFQHAEHYFRILSDSTDPTPSGRRPEDRQPLPYSQDDGYYGSDEDDDTPLNGHGAAQQRQYDARGNSNPQPSRDSGQRDSGQREPSQRDSGQREPGPRDAGPRDTRPRDAAPRQPRPAPTEAAAPAVQGEAPLQGEPQAAPASGDGDAPRPARRGRPRKPRANDDDQTTQQDNSSETESGPVG